MRIIKIILAVLIIQVAVSSCGSKSQPEPSLAGSWKITSAVGNDGRQWTGSFTLTQNGSDYEGLFLWDAIDGQSTGTDQVTGNYNGDINVLTLQSKTITGNIESVYYTLNVTSHGTKMNGIWTGSSDGTLENPGKLTAVKQ